MSGLQLEKALKEVLRDYHKMTDSNANAIKETITQWYYTTKLTAENAISLLVEYCENGKLTLQGRL